MIRIALRSAAAFLTLMIGGCAHYEPRPLDPNAVVMDVDDIRRNPEGDRTDQDKPQQPDAELTLERVADWMRVHGPDVRDAVAAYQAATARADVETPLPNPSLQIGPMFGFGPDVQRQDAAAFGSISFSIPLGDRRARTDDLHRVQAEVARIDGVARHRELYLELRRLWLRLRTAKAVLADRSRLCETTRACLTTTRRMVEAGQATALDVALFELETARADADRLTGQARVASASAGLARLVGVHLDLLSGVPQIDDMPQQPIPAVDSLRQLLIENHTELARLRARYDQAEATLRLEIARQTPDLQLGPTVSDEVGDRRTLLGLALGLRVPLFDRNQKAIAAARGRREELRTRFEAAANRTLAELDRTHAMAKAAAARRRVFDEDVLPRARQGVDLARRSVAAGVGDARRFLDAQRSLRAVVIESRSARLAEIEAWMDLEAAVGTPLLRLAGGQDLRTPSAPGALSKESER